MTASTLQDFQTRIEEKLLFQLTLNMKTGKLSGEEAQEIAHQYLALKPNSKEELLQSLINMGKVHIVIEPVVVTFSKEYDEEFKHDILSQMSEKINHGDIDSAIDLGKQEGPVHA